jgi:lactoylglutathione lyase
MRYLHTMIRVRDLTAALRFFCDGLGLRELRRRDHEQGRFTLVFLGEPSASPKGERDEAGDSPQIELTYNWDQPEPYTVGRNFGHVAYEVDDIYAACQRFVDLGYTISRPPRDGHMAFVRSPDLQSVELLQKGPAKPPAEPWASMKNVGEW